MVRLTPHATSFSLLKTEEEEKLLSVKQINGLAHLTRLQVPVRKIALNRRLQRRIGNAVLQSQVYK